VGTLRSERGWTRTLAVTGDGRRPQETLPLPDEGRCREASRGLLWRAGSSAAVVRVQRPRAESAVREN